MAGIILKQMAAFLQTIPETGKDVLFFDTDGTPKYKDSSSNIFPLVGASGYSGMDGAFAASGYDVYRNGDNLCIVH